jgi:hypothetical protein
MIFRYHFHYHYHLDQEQDYHILTNLCNGHINFVKLTYEEYWTVTIKNNDDDDDPDPSDDHDPHLKSCT